MRTLCGIAPLLLSVLAGCDVEVGTQKMSFRYEPATDELLLFIEYEDIHLWSSKDETDEVDEKSISQLASGDAFIFGSDLIEISLSNIRATRQRALDELAGKAEGEPRAPTIIKEEIAFSELLLQSLNIGKTRFFRNDEGHVCGYQTVRLSNAARCARRMAPLLKRGAEPGKGEPMVRLDSRSFLFQMPMEEVGYSSFRRQVQTQGIQTAYRNETLTMEVENHRKVSQLEMRKSTGESVVAPDGTVTKRQRGSITQFIKSKYRFGTDLNGPAERKAHLYPSLEDDDAGTGHSYAFLVGVSKYDKKSLRPLSYTLNDVFGLRDAFLDSGVPPENVVVMHDDYKQLESRNHIPERDKILQQLDLLLAELTPQDDLIVALSGHGVQFRGETKSYFCPVDASLEDQSTLIGFRSIYDRLDKCKARRKLLLVDACRNDPQSDLSKSGSDVKLNSVTRPQLEAIPGGTVALFSCAAGQKSYEAPGLKHGVFFYHVIKAMNGAADNGDGNLSLDELITYAKRDTQTFVRRRLNAKQTPHFRGEFTGTWTLTRVPKSR